MTQDDFVALLSSEEAPCFVFFDVYQDLATSWEDGVHAVAKSAGRSVKTARDPISKKDGFLFFRERDF